MIGMVAASLPPNELERLDALRRARLLDTPQEDFFEDIVDQVRKQLGAPIVLVSLIDEARQWFKACRGLDVSETDRDVAFCAHAILNADPLVVADATADIRFSRNPLVLGAPHIRAYAGAPIERRNGLRLGTVCAIDTKARLWSADEIDILARYARLTARYIEAREAVAEQDRQIFLERALHRAEARYHSLISAMREGVVVQAQSGAIIEANAAAASILGVTEDELYGRTSMDPRWRAITECGEPFPGEQHPAMVALRTGIAQTGVVMGVEAPGSERRWIVINSLPVAQTSVESPRQVVTTFADITDQKRRALELAESEARYRLLADHSPDIIVRVGRDGAIRYISPSCRRLGFEPEAAIGRSGLSFVAPEDRDFVAERVQGLLSGPEPDPSLRREYRLIKADGSHLWVDGNPSIVRDADGTPVEIITVLRDVSLRREVEAALERANQAKSNFLATMSHELRTPLNAVMGIAQHLARQDLSSSIRDNVAILHSASLTLRALVDDVLDAEAIESGHLRVASTAFDLGRALEESVALFGPLAAEKGVALRAEIADACRRHVLADKGRMQQVFNNLISNAVKFTDSGEVLVTAAVSKTEHCVELLVDIADTGSGVPAHVGKSLFTRFADSVGSGDSRGGSGLGLYLARQIARVLGGDVDLTRTSAAGSVFSIRLPIHECDAPAPAESKPLNEAITSEHSLRLLVAEDNALNRDIIRLLLEPFAVELMFAVDGLQADAFLSEHAFDLVLMDVRMPGIDGLEVVRRLRQREAKENRARLPVVFLSASVTPKITADAHVAGADGYVSKPIIAEEMLSAINEALRCQASGFAA